jgi:hypothetical protein
MERGSQATVRQDAHHAGAECSATLPRPYATWTAQIARMVAVVAIEVALQQALGPLFLRRS